MAYIIKVKEQYLIDYQPYMWSKFSPFRQLAQTFTLDEAKEAKKVLLNNSMWRDFEEEDIQIIRTVRRAKAKDVLGEMIKNIDPESLAKTRDEMMKEIEEDEDKE